MIVQVPTMGLTWFGRDCSETAEMSFFSQACKRLQSRKEKRNEHNIKYDAHRFIHWSSVY